MSFTKFGIETAKLINYDARTKGIDENGFIEIGALVKAKFGGSYLEAKIIARTKNPIKYYVHYLKMNRRMDVWLDANVVELLDTETRDTILNEEEVQKKNVQDSNEVGGIEKLAVSQEGVINFIEPEHKEQGMDEMSLKEHEEVTKFKNINIIELGKYQINTWYYSPFPKEYFPDGILDVLYFCEYCLNFYKSKRELTRHQKRCTIRTPPGDEIYRNNGLAMFEVDGAGSYKEHIYCQNLSFLAKLFLDHKTLYYDVDPFFYYVLTEYDSRGYHIVGYYSKEKYSDMGYNLACILTIPCYQRNGYGHFLIDFSYALSKLENKVGSPEKPLSDLGLISFRSYWKRVLIKYIVQNKDKEITLMDICKATSLIPDDIINTFYYLDIFKSFNNDLIITITPKIMELYNQLESKKVPEVDISKIIWSPLLVEEAKGDKFFIDNLPKYIDLISYE